MGSPENYIQEAEQRLEAAEYLLEGGFYEDSVSRACRVVILGLFTLILTASAASLDVNSSKSLQYYGDGNTLDFEVATDGQVNAKDNLTLGGNSIEDLNRLFSDTSGSSFFGGCSSGNYVESINSDGSVNCASDSTSTGGADDLNETLTAGNEANQSIDFMGNDIVSAGTTNLDLKTSGNVEVPSGYVNISSGDLNVSGQLDVGSTECASDEYLGGDGTCYSDSTGSSTTNVETLNETLTAGHRANQSIDMMGNNISAPDALLSGGQDIDIIDSTNNQDIARFREGGNVQLPSGNLTVSNPSSLSGELNVGGTVDVAGAGVIESFGNSDVRLRATGGNNRGAMLENTDGEQVGWRSTDGNANPLHLEGGSDVLVDIDHPDAGTSTSFKITTDGHATRLFELFDEGDVEIPAGDLNVSGNATIRGVGNVTLKNADLDLGSNGLRNVGSTDCASNEAILGDGSCGAPADADADSTNELQTLNETLLQGNLANQTIDMMDNNIDQVKEINSGGEKVEVGGDVNMSGSTPKMSLGSGMTVQRTSAGNMVISD